jgi:hypothetical protein
MYVGNDEYLISKDVFQIFCIDKPGGIIQSMFNVPLYGSFLSVESLYMVIISLLGVLKDGYSDYQYRCDKYDDHHRKKYPQLK